MKKVLFLLFHVLILLIYAGCNSKQKDITLPVYNENFNDTVKKEKHNNNIASEGLEDNNIEEDDQLSVFKGLETDTENQSEDNLSINSKLSTDTCLICIDAENNVTYYANYGKDDFIYQLKDGISSLVLDKKTRNIKLWDGNIYFLGFTDEDKAYSNIYRYNLTDKRLELLVETDACWLYICSEGIFYAKYIPEKGYIREGYKLAFDSNKPEPYEWHYFRFYKGYMIVYDRVEDYSKLGTIRIIKRATKECVLEIHDVLGGVSVYQDKLYYIDAQENNTALRKLHIVNLLTGEHDICDPNIMDRMNYKPVDYTVYGEDIYLSVNVSNTVFKYNKDGLFKYRLDEGGFDEYGGLYTNGSVIFATKNDYETDKGLVQFIASENSIEVREME